MDEKALQEARSVLRKEIIISLENLPLVLQNNYNYIFNYFYFFRIKVN